MYIYRINVFAATEINIGIAVSTKNDEIPDKIVCMHSNHVILTHTVGLER